VKGRWSRFGRWYLRGRRRDEHDWPLALSEDEQLALTTVASKSYVAGLAGVEEPNDPLHRVVDGVVDADLAKRRVEWAIRERERADRVARAPAEAARARRLAEIANSADRARVEAENEAAIRRADSLERDADDLVKLADKKAKGALRLRRTEEQLPRSQREPAQLVVKSGTFDLSLGKANNWLGLAVLMAVIEGAVIMAPVLKDELNLPDLMLAGLTGGAVSLMATAVAVIAGLALVAEWEEKSWSRRALLIAITLMLAAVVVGFVVARVEGWWVGCAVSATWTAAVLSGVDMRRRAYGIALLRHADELDDEADDLRSRAAERRVAAAGARAGASATAEVIDPEQPPLLDADPSLLVDGTAGELATERAAGLKEAFRGVVDHEIGLGQADRRERLARDDARAGRRPRLAWQTAMAAAAIGLLLAAGGYAVGSGDDDPRSGGAASPPTAGAAR